MKLHDIHFCFGFVLSKRDKYFKDFILDLYSKFNEDRDYSREEIQRILYQSYPRSNKTYVGNSGKDSCFDFIKHTIRNHKNY